MLSRLDGFANFGLQERDVNDQSTQWTAIDLGYDFS
jgi:hypothetical protein